MRRLPVLTSLTDAVLVQKFAHHVLALADGRLVFDGPPGDAADQRRWLSSPVAPSA